MTWLIDVGNSAIKWAQVKEDGRLGDSQWQLHRGVPDVTARLIERWRGDVTPGASVIACNVAGTAVVAAVEQAARTLELGAVRWLHAQPCFDGPISLINGYRDPTQLGADRWHCLLGACSLWPGQSLVVVNAGTATTVDCVEANKFVGGFIAPGVRLMHESLARETAGLPSAAGTASDFPDNTDDAIVSGVLDAQAGLVQQVWRRFAAQLNASPHVVLTGGNADAVRARLSIDPVAIEHNLVLRGLALRAHRLDNS